MFAFFFFLAGGVLIVIAAIAMVPASIIYKTASGGKGELMLAAVFMAVLTAAVLLLGSLFFRAYMFFRVPVIFQEDRKPWREEKKHVHVHFWGIAGRLLLFDAVFALFQFAAAYVRIPGIAFILQWMFITLFFTVQSTYIFALSQEYHRVPPNVPSGTDLGGT